MNVKKWALFFVVTLSVNYVSATFFPHGGFSHGRSGRRSYASWNDCDDRLHGVLRSHIKGIRHKIQSKYGGDCSLGHRHLDNFSLKNVKATGFGDFTYGDTCQYNVEKGDAYLHFAFSFEKIIVQFFLEILGDVGGIFGEFFEAIFGIIGHFVNKILKIFFKPFKCFFVVKGNHHSGFSLHDFYIQKPDHNIGFLGGLAGHEDTLSSFSSLFFEPLYFLIDLFLKDHIRPICEKEIGNWDFSRFGFKLGSGGRFGGYGGSTGGSGYDGDSESEERIGYTEGGDTGAGGRFGGSHSYRYEYNYEDYGEDDY